MLAPNVISIGGRNYTIIPFNPIDAFNFIHDRGNAIVYGKSMKELGLRVLKQCNTEMGHSLGDEKVFQDVFSSYPQDMIELEERAVEALVAPFEKQKQSTS